MLGITEQRPERGGQEQQSGHGGDSTREVADEDTDRQAEQRGRRDGGSDAAQGGQPLARAYVPSSSSASPER